MHSAVSLDPALKLTGWVTLEVQDCSCRLPMNFQKAYEPSMVEMQVGAPADPLRLEPKVFETAAEVVGDHGVG